MCDAHYNNYDSSNDIYHVKYNNHSSKKKERNIMDALDQYSFNQEVKVKANEIYLSLRAKHGWKGNNRKKLLYFLTLCAHDELGIPVEAIRLAAQFGLSPNDIHNVKAKFSPVITGYHPPSKKVSVLDMLPGYCRELYLSEEYTKQMLFWAKDFIDKHPDILQEGIYNVAGGMIDYFNKINGVQMDIAILSKVVNRGWQTIERNSKMIAMLDNS
jgi:hypothetical protein